MSSSNTSVTRYGGLTLRDVDILDDAKNLRTWEEDIITVFTFMGLAKYLKAYPPKERDKFRTEKAFEDYLDSYNADSEMACTALKSRLGVAPKQEVKDLNTA
jgi:hypothetical protein